MYSISYDLMAITENAGRASMYTFKAIKNTFADLKACSMAGFSSKTAAMAALHSHCNRSCRRHGAHLYSLSVLTNMERGTIDSNYLEIDIDGRASNGD